MKKQNVRSILVFVASSLLSVQIFAADLTVGGKGFTEQLLLAEMTTQLLTARGHTVDTRTGMGTSLLRKALENKQVDIYWAYTGTAFLNFHKNTFKQQSGEEIYQSVKKEDAKNNIVWLQKSQANNTYALAVQAQVAKDKSLYTLADLASQMNDGAGYTLGCNIEFYKRDDGLKPLQKAYGFKFPRSDVKRMETGLVYTALKDGQVDVGLVFATDGRIPAFHLVVLKDTKGFFPAYAITPVIRAETLAKTPSLEQDLNALSSKLNDEVMASLNAQVDVDKKSVRQVAEEFLKEQHLI